jgi:hypothetical protein
MSKLPKMTKIVVSLRSVVLRTGDYLAMKPGK